MAMWRRVALGVILLGLAAVFVGVVDRHYPVEHWLFWRYARYWAWSIVMVLGSFGVGEAIVLKCFGRTRGLHAHWFISFCVGLLGFGLLIFAAGMLGLYGRVFFWTLPLAYLAAGVPRLRVLRRDVLPRLTKRSPPTIRGILPFVILFFGAYAWLLIYAGVMVPDNVMFDSRWKHLAIAEGFATQGEIFRFDQGWMFAARPHFASYLFTWAFCIPDGELFDQILMCAHIEFVIFALTTFLGIGAMVRRVIPDADPKLVWVARFLFPGVFLYDSNPSIGADHIAAAYGVALFLTTHDMLRRGFRARDGVLVGLMASGLVLIKESAATVTIPSAAVVIVAGVAWREWSLRGERLPFRVKRAWVFAGLALVATGLVTTTPLWLKNLIWYGDPMYPSLYEYFWPRPWSEDSAYLLQWGFFDHQFKPWVTEGNRVVETAKVLFTWSFKPHDWKPFHGVTPVIGSLATILLPCLLFLKRTKGIWILVFWIHFGILTWFQVLPQDRYLQVLMPFMAAFTACVLIRLWRARFRVIPVLLIGVQLVWGGDVPFISRSMLPRLVKLLGAAHNRKAKTDKAKYENRLRTQGTFQKVGDYLPEGARIVVHEIHPHLGVKVPAYSDWQTYVFGLSYGLMKNPRELWERYRELGITHLWWKKERSRGWDSVAGDLMFFSFAHIYAVDMKRIDDSYVARVPDDPPPGADEFNDAVLVMACGNTKGKAYPGGLYHLPQMHVSSFGPKMHDYPEPYRAAKTKQQQLALLDQVDYLVVDPACNRRLPKEVTADFNVVTKRRPHTKARRYDLWLRTRASRRKLANPGAADRTRRAVRDGEGPAKRPSPRPRPVAPERPTTPDE